MHGSNVMFRRWAFLLVFNCNNIHQYKSNIATVIVFVHFNHHDMSDWLRTQYWWSWWPAACVRTQNMTCQGHEDHSHRISQCSFLLSSVELLCLSFSVVPATIKRLISSATRTILSPDKLATNTQYWENCSVEKQGTMMIKWEPINNCKR